MLGVDIGSGRSEKFICELRKMSTNASCNLHAVLVIKNPLLIYTMMQCVETRNENIFIILYYQLFLVEHSTL